ncbi:MAG: proline iminopeptidase [Lysobacteraceae bacterium]|nr:MAG: proline iminopeptidase [Xanthomonadaceae bacterium]
MSNYKQHLYPEIEPYNVGRLKVSDLHTIVYEEVGNPQGRPALFLHGGPGVGITPSYRQFFDPAHYRVILVDQRGAGRSTPHAEIRDNTTWDIVEDLEKLKGHLGIEDWVVMGGSWGSLLALCYAIQHPESVAAMIIRGIFLGRQFEIDWIHGPNGAALVYPEEFERYKALVPDAEDNVAAYCQLLSSDDEAVRREAAKAWSRWEGTMVTVFPDPEGLEEMLDSPSAMSIARIESHFTKHKFYLEHEHWVLDNAARMADIPTYIVHGRYDTVCPPISAWELHKALPKSELVIVPDGAHSPVDGGMTKELVRASGAVRDAGI